jgi:hypothetical protein
MRPVFRFVLAAGLAAAGSPVLAQSNAVAQANPAAQPNPGGEAGFFPPKPAGDLSLFRTLPPEAYQPPAPVAPPAPASAPAAPAAPTAPLVVVVPPAVDNQADLQDVRAARAREEAAARMPAPINGAFTGLTDERDR